MMVAQKDPVTQFKEHFLAKYKLADNFKQEKVQEEKKEVVMEETKGGDDGEEMEEGHELMEGDEEDQIALADPNFKLWKNSL